MTSNSIMEALASHPAPNREDGARRMAAYCREQAELCLNVAKYYQPTPDTVATYMEGLEWEAKAARILQSIVFQREPEFTRTEREALLRLIGGAE